LKIRLVFLACLLVFCLSSLQAFAHPHAWIDYRTHVVLDDDNRITAIKEHWVFDEYYTEFALHDFDPHKTGKLGHDELMLLANDNLKNLKAYDYFTSFEKDGKKVAIKSISDTNSYLVSGHIALDFTVWLAEPADAVKQKVSYRIYDPSYYISMLHDKKDAIILEGKHAASCQHELITPQPDITKTNFAAAIDKNGQAPEELGSFFAQRMIILCK